MDAIDYLSTVRPSEVVTLESTLQLRDEHAFYSLPLVLQIYIIGQDLRKNKTSTESKKFCLADFKRNWH